MTELAHRLELENLRLRQSVARYEQRELAQRLLAAAQAIEAGALRLEWVTGELRYVAQRLIA